MRHSSNINFLSSSSSYAFWCIVHWKYENLNNLLLTRKKADDRNIITFERVCSIFFMNNNQPLLLVDYLETTESLQCTITSSNTDFYYEHIRYGDNSTKKKLCIIEILDFIEKCVYFQSSEDISYYFRFPTALSKPVPLIWKGMHLI